MVASIATVSLSNASYYTELSRDDYYHRGGEPPGEWLGSGAKELGLEGQVDAMTFTSILKGMGAHGKPLVRNANTETRQAGWDITFSAPKSVSVIWAVADQQIRSEIEQAHHKAVRETIANLEKGGCWTRRGKGGVKFERAKSVVASFFHATSRAGDPVLHSHCVYANVCVRADGTTGTLSSRELYKRKMFAGGSVPIAARL